MYEKRSLEISTYISTIKETQRYILETIFIFILLIFIYIIKNNEINPIKYTALLGMFGIGLLRLYPSSSKILFCITEVKNNLPSMKLLSKSMLSETYKKKIVLTNKIKNNEKIKIKVKNLSFKVGLKKIIDIQNLVITNGDKLFISGKSGTGKSTLLKLLSGQIKPATGYIKINDVHAFRNFYKIRNIFSYVPQNPIILDTTILQNITLEENKNKIDYNFLKTVLKVSNLENFVNSRKNKLNTSIGQKGDNISGGEKQRISIARALYRNPHIIILDEFTNQLDKKNENLIVQNIMKYFKDKIILISSHNQNLQKYCNKIIKFK